MSTIPQQFWGSYMDYRYVRLEESFRDILLLPTYLSFKKFLQHFNPYSVKLRDKVLIYSWILLISGEILRIFHKYSFIIPDTFPRFQKYLWNSGISKMTIFLEWCVYQSCASLLSSTIPYYFSSLILSLSSIYI